MATDAVPAPDLAAENAALRARVAALEARLVALEQAPLAGEAHPWQAMLRAFPDVLTVCDAAGRCLEAYCGTPGRLPMPAARLVGKTPAEVFPPALAARMQAVIAQAVASGQVVEWLHTMDDRVEPARRRWFNARLVAYQHGTETRVLWLSMDVSERVWASEHFRQVVEDCPAGLSIVSWPAGQVLYVNQPLARLLSASASEMVGQHAVDFYRTPAERTRVLAALESTGELHDWELTLRRADGTPLPVAMSMRRIRYAGQEAVIASYSDLTRRLATEEALRASQGQWRFLIEHLPGIAWTTNVELILTFAGGQGLTQRGVAGHHLVGRTVLSCVKGDAHHPLALAHQRARAGEVTACECEISQRRYRATLAPLHDAAGSIMGVIGLAADITEQWRAEREQQELDQRLQQMQKLESLGVLATGVAHDFNNLLVSILGHAGLALLELPADAPARPLVERLEAAALRAAELTRQMLAFAGRGRGLASPVNLNELITDSAQLLRTAAGDPGAFSLELAAMAPRVAGDAAQLRQLLMNLVTNAGEASASHGGAVTVRTGTLTCATAIPGHSYLTDALPAGTYAWLEVSDRGSGMTAELLAKIFDPFFSTRALGRGLGLPVVLGIVRGHHGTIQVTSTPGGGSCFRVLLPVWRDALASASPVAPRRGTGVLVVENDADVLDFVTFVLNRAGYQPRRATTAAAALALLATEPDAIQGVILALSLVQLGGPGLFTELRQRYPALPILLTSGYREPDARHVLGGQQAQGFLHKPFGHLELEAAVARLWAAPGAPGAG